MPAAQWYTEHRAVLVEREEPSRVEIKCLRHETTSRRPADVHRRKDQVSSRLNFIDNSRFYGELKSKKWWGEIYIKQADYLQVQKKK